MLSRYLRPVVEIFLIILSVTRKVEIKSCEGTDQGDSIAKNYMYSFSVVNHYRTLSDITIKMWLFPKIVQEAEVLFPFQNGGIQFKTVNKYLNGNIDK